MNTYDGRRFNSSAGVYTAVEIDAFKTDFTRLGRLTDYAGLGSTLNMGYNKQPGIVNCVLIIKL